MKGRISQEARDTRALYIEFKEIKNKCEKALRLHGLPLTDLEQFRQLDQQFVIDLNILSLEQITQRRNRVMQAIDQIMTVESDIKLKALRKQSKTPEAQQVESTQKTERLEPEPAPPVQTRQIRQKSCYQPSKPAPKQSRSKVEVPPIEKEQLQSIQNEMNFDHLELLNVWGRYKSTQEESCEDKLDRLGKIVGNLRINLKTITGKEKEATVRTNLTLHPEYVKLQQQNEQLKMLNEELRMRNADLVEENKNIRLGMGEKALQLDPKKLGNELRYETLHECKDFKIVKISSKMLRTRHSSNYSLEKAKEPRQDLDVANLIKYTHLLQERIVDSLPVRSLIGQRQPSMSTASTIQLTKRDSESPEKLKNSQVHSNGTPQQMSTVSEINQVNSAQNLSQINTKLNKLREQRKKMFEDDDLWSEIQRLKI